MKNNPKRITVDVQQGNEPLIEFYDETVQCEKCLVMGSYHIGNNVGLCMKCLRNTKWLDKYAIITILDDGYNEYEITRTTVKNEKCFVQARNLDEAASLIKIFRYDWEDITDERGDNPKYEVEEV